MAKFQGEYGDDKVTGLGIMEGRNCDAYRIMPKWGNESEKPISDTASYLRI